MSACLHWRSDATRATRATRATVATLATPALFVELHGQPPRYPTSKPRGRSPWLIPPVESKLEERESTTAPHHACPRSGPDCAGSSHNDPIRKRSPNPRAPAVADPKLMPVAIQRGLLSVTPHSTTGGARGSANYRRGFRASHRRHRRAPPPSASSANPVRAREAASRPGQETRWQTPRQAGSQAWSHFEPQIAARISP